MFCTNHPAVTEGVRPCSRCARPFCGDCLVVLQGRSYCATCKVEQLADVRSGVDATAVALAGIGRRFVAMVIDGLILAIPIWILMAAIMMPSIMANQAPESPGWFSWVGFAWLPVPVIYEGLMLSFKSQTLGKMAMHIRVVRADGGPISRGQAWIRPVVRVLFVSFLAIINYLPAFFTKEKTCIHDMAARTRVALA